MFLWVRTIVTAMLVSFSAVFAHGAARPPAPAPAAPTPVWEAAAPATPATPAISAGGYQNTAYSYTFPALVGWMARSGNGQPVGRTSDLILTGDSATITVRVCTGGLPCSPPDPTDIVAVRTESDWALGGVAAVLQQYALHNGTFQNDLVAVRNAETYDIGWTTPTWSAGMPGGHSLCSWSW